MDKRDEVLHALGAYLVRLSNRAWAGEDMGVLSAFSIVAHSAAMTPASECLKGELRPLIDDLVTKAARWGKDWPNTNVEYREALNKVCSLLSEND